METYWVLYGHPERSKRHVTWDLIRTLHASSPFPWWLVRDFNDMLDPSEKLGHVSHLEWFFRSFREVTSDCNLNDLDL